MALLYEITKKLLSSGSVTIKIRKQKALTYLLGLVLRIYGLIPNFAGRPHRLIEALVPNHGVYASTRRLLSQVMNLISTTHTIHLK